MTDVHKKEVRSYNMSRIKSKGTKIEIMLAKALWTKGARYRKNDITIFGKPDFVFKKLKLAVFCDSEFWHGKDIAALEARIGTNKEFWINKIRRNVERDRQVNEHLTARGWTVLRFWEKDIKKNTEQIADCVCSVLIKLKQTPYSNLKTPL
ncbi:very short patch repair endonuclease [Mucilaginibacter sp. Bleaf8]|uniref:very short patch repair endonuclease n=1 Tax=Mucilaginibacter sp. Bleaf8 TaxID=2834430 RepID=UPI001BCD5691|nr:very short patch repair endonuclease [Mucilaginibacter sp. Bleaf8]MBS7565655.1 very short patch repair endonuclease [Mucilaginibacter sp. Bleaf8]